MRMLEKFELHAQDSVARKGFDEIFKAQYPDLYVNYNGINGSQKENDAQKCMKELGWELYCTQGCVDRTIDFLINHLKIIESNFQILALRVGNLEAPGVAKRKAEVEKKVATKKKAAKAKKR